MRAASATVNEKTEGYGLDVLVNKAGFGLMAPMELITEEDMRSQFESNVFGLITLTQQFLPAMRSRRSGRIINIGSVGGRITLPLQGVYCATKYAVEGLSDAMRLELSSFGIFVSLVEPGVIRTRFGEKITSTVSKYQSMNSPYQWALKKYDEVVESANRKAPGPECIARTVAKIVRSRRPRARYVSPRYIHLAIAAVKGLPTRWIDFVMRKVLGLSRMK